MDTKTLASLNPTGNTSAEITAAIERAATARIEAEHRAKTASDQLEAGTLSITSSQRRNLRDALEDGAADAQQIAAISAALEGALVEARDREEGESLAAAHAALTARIAAHEDGWLGTYRKHEAALRALLAERQAVVDAADRHNSAAANFCGFHIDADELRRPIDATTFYADPEQRARAKAEQMQIELAAEQERQRTRWEIAEAKQRRFDEQRAYAASRDIQGAFVTSESVDSKMVQRT